MLPYSIPDPKLETTHNYTPFRHFVSQKMAVGRVFCDVIVLKGSFNLASGKLEPAKEQTPIVLADHYRDATDATLSSLEHHGELHLAKPGADVIVTGTAVPPRGRPVSSWLCSVVLLDRAKTRAELTLEATGPRRFRHRSLRGWSLSEPEPTNGVAIAYELAFGGAHENRHAADEESRWNVYEPNPSGTGFFDEALLDERATYPGPQWQFAEAPIATIGQRAALAGFGPVARSWKSRLDHAGTYDEAWLARTREEAERGIVPDYAADFDAKFFHCAHPALICSSRLRGDEQVSLRGFIAEAPELVFQLPEIRPHAEVLPAVGPWRKLPIELDTIHVRLDASLVELTWRLVLDPSEGIGTAFLSL